MLALLSISRSRIILLFLFLTLAFGSCTPIITASEPRGAATSSSAVSTTSTASTDQAAKSDRWFEVENIGRLVRNDFVIAPGKTELEILPGETVTYEITVSNRISDDRIFELEFEDMAGTSDGSRSVQLFGEEYGPYTIKDFFSVPEQRFELDLGERARIPVTISIPPDAEPGGYYGAVLVSTVRSEGGTGGAGTRSPLITRVGSLFFVTVPGDIEEAGTVRGLTLTEPQWWYESGPIDFSLLVENTGSVHLNPYGEVQITNMFGETVGFLELDPWFVLPSSLRLREFSWDRQWLLGRYVATAEVELGFDNRTETASVAFWVLPWRIVGGTFLTVFLVLFAIRAFFRTFELKRRD